MKRLEEKVKQYDTEIEKLCNTNYQMFVDTFNELLSVREDTANLKVKDFLLLRYDYFNKQRFPNLKKQLIDNNDKIQLIGNSLITRVDDLVKETKKQNNILLAIETLNKLLPVFNIYRQLKIQMKEKKDYYQALKLLEDLEVNFLPVVRKYRFSKAIQESIPLFKEEIKTETIADLKDFLEKLKNQSEKVGKIANQQVAMFSLNLYITKI